MNAAEIDHICDTRQDPFNGNLCGGFSISAAVERMLVKGTSVRPSYLMRKYVRAKNSPNYVEPRKPDRSQSGAMTIAAQGKNDIENTDAWVDWELQRKQSQREWRYARIHK